MKYKKHSLKGIASKLNVSVTTVSFVLNGKAKEKKISEGVTKMVLDYIEEINYKPNQLAQSLRTGKSKIIVFMVEDISNLFFARVARFIEDIAYDKGYKVIFCSNENDDKRSIELIDLFNERQVDGFIIIPSAGLENAVKQLIEKNIPVVLFDRYFPSLETNYVIIDNENASYSAAKHLIDNGYKNISFITIDTDQTQMRDRLKGYKKAIKEFDLRESVLGIPFNKNISKDKYEKIKNFFVLQPNMDSVFFATNYLTQTGLMVIKENFPNRVNELGIITFDDNEFFRIHTPSISAVAQPQEAIAEELMKIMFDLLKLKKEKKSLIKTTLNAELKIRESSLPKVSYKKN